MRRHVRLQPAQLLAPRQASVPQKEDHFLERGVIRQRVDVVAAIAENSFFAVDETDFGFPGDHALQPRPRCRRQSHARPSPYFILGRPRRAVT